MQIKILGKTGNCKSLNFKESILKIPCFDKFRECIFAVCKYLNIIFFCLFPLSLFAKDYYSENLMEPDKIGTAWMFKYYVDQEANFIFVAKDSTVKGAIAFDLPKAKYRRYPRYSSCMSVIKFHNIKNERAMKLARLIDEIELDFWGAEKSAEARELELELLKIIEEEKDPQEILRKGFIHINKFLSVPHIIADY